MARRSRLAVRFPAARQSNAGPKTIPSPSIRLYVWLVVRLQAAINMASSLSMIPTKGMTLPFISYGGSSLLALSLTMGMLLALTRKRPGMGGIG
jgi:hypothetical protein